MTRRKLRKRLEFLGGRIAAWVFLRFSSRLNKSNIGRWGRRLGDFMFLMSRRYRRVAIKNLTAAYPEWSSEKVRATARNTCRHFAKGMLEFLHILHLPPEELDAWIDLDGKEYMDEALAKGHGVILITAHLGNWEIFARKLVLSGYKVNVIARNSDDPAMTGIANKMRETAGYHVLDRDNSALPAVRSLKRNEVLGILPDQNTFTGIFVDFFGKPCATATGPAVFALRTGAPVVCGFARRDEEGRFRARIYPPITVTHTGNEKEDIHMLTQAITTAIEDEIRKDPSQWLWLHDRWKRASEAVKESMETSS
ncbi:MAG: lysophospholipid acyltransferase family protein [Armatimonadota bacterium]